MHNRIVTYCCYFLLFTFYFLLFSCAQIVIPGGGPKDSKPPRVEKYIPDSAATNFNAKTITIAFDEYIQLADLQKELTISPPMSVPPEVKAKGKMLHIELKDSLKKNTTYVLNFGSSIRDFSESNAKPDFRYIFSTGSYIDTLKLTGIVKDAYDQKTEKGILVMLYESFDDSMPYKAGPSYFAKTNADGSYKISNIRPGKYKAFALKDGNSNYKYDIPTENIGFSDTLVKIFKNAKLDFRLFKEEPKQQRLLKSFTAGYGNTVLLYAKPVKEISYKPLNSSTQTETFLTEFNPGRDSIRIWFPVFSKDSLHFKVIADATVTGGHPQGETTIDTIRIGTGQFKKESGGRGEEFKLTATTNANKNMLFELGKVLELRFNHPIKTFTEKGIVFKQNKIQISTIFLRSQDFSVQRSFNIGGTENTVMMDTLEKPIVDSLGNMVYMPYVAPLDTGNYALFIPPATFTDIFGLTNDTIKLDFQTQEEKYYGTLKLTLKMKKKITYVLELVNEKGVVCDFVSSDKGIFSYQYLPPGAYKFRIIYDTNEDGKWTTGNYLKRTKPETIIYYSGAVTIRSNWDLELDWKVE